MIEAMLLIHKLVALRMTYVHDLIISMAKGKFSYLARFPRRFGYLLPQQPARTFIVNQLQLRNTVFKNGARTLYRHLLAPSGDLCHRSTDPGTQ